MAAVLPSCWGSGAFGSLIFRRFAPMGSVGRGALALAVPVAGVACLSLYEGGISLCASGSAVAAILGGVSVLLFPFVRYR